MRIFRVGKYREICNVGWQMRQRGCIFRSTDTTENVCVVVYFSYEYVRAGAVLRG